MAFVTRSVSDAAATAIAAGTYGTSSSHRAFPSVCYHGTIGAAASAGSSGVARIIYRRGTSHASYDGSLCSITKVDGGAWSSEQVIIDGTQSGGSGATNTPNSPLPDGLKPDVRDVHIWKAASGRLLISFTQHPTGDYGTGIGHAWKTWFTYSDDNGATWSTPVEVTFTGSGAPSFTQGVYGDNIIELPSGNLLVSGYAPIGGVFEEYVARSTDGGVTWSYRGQMAAAISGFNSVEACMAVMPDGSLLATFHTEDGVPTNIYKVTSTDEGATWSAPTLVMASAASNRNEILTTPDGDIILAAGFNATSYANAIKQSFDGAASFSGSYVTLSTNPHGSGGPLFAAGCAIGAAATSPNMGFATSYENSGQDIASIQWTTLTRGATDLPATGYGNTLSAGYGSATAEAAAGSLLVLPASSAWEQVGTSIFVRTVNEPCTVEATITGTAGGLLRFAGADADLFDASLDGTTWAATVDVPPGTSTVHLRVTPEAPGTTLSAEIGVPV